MREFAKHLEVTLRSFARQPGLALIVVLTLALGIGASTALFAYLSAILWPKIDAPSPERVVWVYPGTPEEPRAGASYLEYLTSAAAERRARHRRPQPLRGLGGTGSGLGLLLGGSW